MKEIQEKRSDRKKEKGLGKRIRRKEDKRDRSGETGRNSNEGERER
jgi:hypothetical protein